MNDLQEVTLEYLYVTIPADYVCVYHEIMELLADYGIDMLKDCKAACTKRNSNVIDCYNMFNAAVAARKLGKSKLAETLIKYIKAKINQIKGGSSETSEFTLNIDGEGDIQVLVKCTAEDCVMLADSETIDKIVNYYGGNEQSTWICYFGAGEQYDDIISNTYKVMYNDLTGSHNINVVVTGDYILLNIPADGTFNRITMNGVEVPMAIDSRFTHNSKTYICYKSLNSYNSGLYTLVVE